MDDRDRLHTAMTRWLAFWMFVTVYLGFLAGACAIIAALAPFDLGDILTEVWFFGALFGWRHEHRSRMALKDRLDATRRLLRRATEEGSRVTFRKITPRGTIR